MAGMIRWVVAGSILAMTGAGARSGPHAGAMHRARVVEGASVGRAPRRHVSAGESSTSIPTSSASAALAPVVTPGYANAGAAIARDQCLTIAIGAAAAAECGDLRLVHALPSVRTYGRVHTPTLVYNSDHADPHPIVAANVALPSGTVGLSRVMATLRVNGVERAVRSWSGASWPVGGVARVALGYDASGDATNVYDYALEVTAFYGLVGSVTRTAGKLVVVNRRNSSFGTGWWLAGLEQLMLDQYGHPGLWIGGDGSVRRYSAVPSDTTAWVAPSVDRLDTLKRDSAGTGWVRVARGGTRVLFDGLGRHVATVDRLRHQTTFQYKDAILIAIGLSAPGGQPAAPPAPPTQPAGSGFPMAPPPPNDTRPWIPLDPAPVAAPGTGPTYTLSYDGWGVLARVQVSALPGATVVHGNRGRVESITDPDTTIVAFGYAGPGAARVTSRTDRRRVVTVFRYDAGGKVSASRLDLTDGKGGVTDSIVNRVRALESLGLDAPVDTAVAYARLEGPRRVGDSTLFWLNQNGAPRRIQDAMGANTRLARSNAGFPGLVTELVSANGLVTRSHYDARGNPDTVVVVNPYGDGKDAMTRYTWDGRWDEVTSITMPKGEVTTFFIDTATGNQVWGQDGRGEVSRIYFTWVNGLLIGTRLPGQQCGSFGPTGCEKYEYDGMGNLQRHFTPLGYLTEISSDSLGRPIETRQQVDVAGTTRMLRTTTSFDAMSRDTLTVTSTIGSAEPSVTVRRQLDVTGADSVITRMTSPDTAHIGKMVTRTFRDALGRMVRRVAPDNAVDSTVYDVGGNVAKTYDRNGDSISYAYDVLNRLRRRVTSARHFGPEAIGLARSAAMNGDPVNNAAPGERLSSTYPIDRPNGYDIPVAVDTFVYHPVSGVLTDASNAYAAIQRDYYPNGQLRTERDTLQSWCLCSAPHVYEAVTGYDLNGRRISLRYPRAISPADSASVRYEYDSITGGLQAVTDLGGYRTVLTPDLRSQLARRDFPDGSSQLFTYTNDGTLETETTRVAAALWRNQTFSYDARGKRTNMSDAPDGQPTSSEGATYNVLGQLLSSTSVYGGASKSSTYTLDGFGNMVQRAGAEVSLSYLNGGDASGMNTTTNTSNNGEEFQYYRPQTGRLWYSKWLPERNGGIDTVVVGGPATMNWYDAAGNLTWTGRSVLNISSVNTPKESQNERRMYYGADGKLRAVDSRGVYRLSSAPENSNYYGFSRSFEEYRYDALGRRIATRLDQRCDDKIEFNQYNAACHISGIRRTVWDGEQELGEVQVPVEGLENDLFLGQGDYTSTARNLSPFFGAVAYTYDGQIDQPLAITRLRYANWTAAGSVVESPAFTFYPMWNVNGQSNFVTVMGPGTTGCGDGYPGDRLSCVAFPIVPRGRWLAYQRRAAVPRAWQGSLMEEKQGAGALMYRRNRYYDSESGRFTQEDPIGLAGGVNLYGYAGGDPVNYADPFGLCPPEDTNDGPECGKVAAVGATASWVVGKGGSVSAGIIVYSGEGAGAYWTTGKAEGVSGGLSADLTGSHNMNAFSGPSDQICGGPALGNICGSSNSSGKSVSVSVGYRGGPAMPITATIGTTVTHKVTWKDVKDAVFEWAKPGLDIMTGRQ